MKAIFLGILTISILMPLCASAQQEFRCKSDADCMGFEFCDEDGSCEFPMADWRKGLELEIRGGLSTCVPLDNDCDGRVGEIRPGGGGGIFAGIRPNSKFAIGIDFGYFAFGHDLAGENSDYDHLIRFMNVMAEVRGYVPYGYKGTGFGDIYFKLGLGYVSFKEEYSFSLEEPVNSYPRRLYSPLNLKLGLGTTFYFLQDSAKGDIGVGLNADYLVFFARGDLRCWTPEGGSTIDCEDMDKLHARIHSMQFTAHFKWVLPIF